ncbi:hypothetical protein BROUX41_002337 [Berkeleyomyces rouxiae]|uniref:uncharacterized protein n=1 Tax=Berkeleyomyces rouxiae TaxID=2035830 RepID=UPI003B7B576F
MIAQLWKLFWDNNVEGFSQLLASSAASCATAAPGALSRDSYQGAIYSAQASATPPKASKSRKGLGKVDVNVRDHAGLTLLLRAAASPEPQSIAFVRALLDHPAVDLYAQDPESGWNALHRALYAGNVAIARLLLEKEQCDLKNDILGTGSRVGRLIKTKDHEGLSPFDLYNTTIRVRDLAAVNSLHGRKSTAKETLADSESDQSSDESDTEELATSSSLNADEVYMFGSNKNHSLGVGDGDDRQYPERIQLARPESLVDYLHMEFQFSQDFISNKASSQNEGIPQLIRSQPIVIRNVTLSKLHSAIITDDPFSNLYLSGVGRGGRLGMGDEHTQFRFAPVLGSLATQRVIEVALGQNHTMAVTDKGELWTWGSNTCNQLGYVLSTTPKPNEDPMSLTPRQVFGALKKEVVVGVAASAIHSVAFTATSLYCWGRNVGQIALMDADSRSLAVQPTPRKMAASLFSSPIKMVSASDKATTCLLHNHTIIVFTNYGYNVVRFPTLDLLPRFNARNSASSRSSRNHTQMTKVNYISSGGDTIAALTLSGEVYVMSLNGDAARGHSLSASTTNPSKIKSSVSPPQRIWHVRKDAATSIAVGENGSVMLSTRSGAVWRRVQRDKAKSKKTNETRDAFKFERVPTITGAIAVRGSTYGALCVVRSDTKVTKDLVQVGPQTLWQDIGALFPLQNFTAISIFRGSEAVATFDSEPFKKSVTPFAAQVLRSRDIEKDLAEFLVSASFASSAHDVVLSTVSAPGICIPAHSWLLAGRSSILRKCFTGSREAVCSELQDILTLTHSESGFEIQFQSLDIFGLINLVSVAYTDSIVPVWNYARIAPHNSSRYRQVRAELMRLASRLHMNTLEAAARAQTQIRPSMDVDFRKAVSHSKYFERGDVLLRLDGKQALVHRDLLCQRCPFFRGLFQGYSSGQWLAKRYGSMKPREPVQIDLGHFEPTAFAYVLEHIYADTGLDMFDNLVTPDLDTFGDLVLSVMKIANELMLDRLIEICQSILSRFVTMRNVAGILNEVNITYISGLKTAALEYVCLQLEGFLENHLLDGMNDMLLADLDTIVCQNQLSAQPFSRSRQLSDLIALHPLLQCDIDEERRIRVQEIAWKASGSLDARLGAYHGKDRRSSAGVNIGTSTPTKSLHREQGCALDQSAADPRSPGDRRADEDGGMIFEMDMDLSSTPLPQKHRKSVMADGPLSTGKKFKKFSLVHEPQRLYDSAGEESMTPPKAPWAQSQGSLTQQVAMITENMADATLEEESEWQSVTPAKARKASAVSASPDPFFSASPSLDRLLQPSPSMAMSTNTPKRPPMSTPSPTPQRPPQPTHSSTPTHSLPARPLNLGDLLPSAAPTRAEPKINMTIPPPPTQPAQPLAEIFDEQIEQRERDKEKVRIRPLQEIIEEEQFLQWWQDEQKRVEQQEENERKSMQLIHEIMARETPRPSGGSSSGGGKGKTNGKGKGKAKGTGETTSGTRSGSRPIAESSRPGPSASSSGMNKASDKHKTHNDPASSQKSNSSAPIESKIKQARSRGRNATDSAESPDIPAAPRPRRSGNATGDGKNKGKHTHVRNDAQGQKKKNADEGGSGANVGAGSRGGSGPATKKNGPRRSRQQQRMENRVRDEGAVAS